MSFPVRNVFCGVCWRRFFIYILFSFLFFNFSELIMNVCVCALPRFINQIKSKINNSCPNDKHKHTQTRNHVYKITNSHIYLIEIVCCAFKASETFTPKPWSQRQSQHRTLFFDSKTKLSSVDNRKLCVYTFWNYKLKLYASESSMMMNKIWRARKFAQDDEMLYFDLQLREMQSDPRSRSENKKKKTNKSAHITSTNLERNEWDTEMCVYYFVFVFYSRLKEERSRVSMKN